MESKKGVAPDSRRLRFPSIIYACGRLLVGLERTAPVEACYHAGDLVLVAAYDAVSRGDTWFGDRLAPDLPHEMLIRMAT